MSHRLFKLLDPMGQTHSRSFDVPAEYDWYAVAAKRMLVRMQSDPDLETRTAFLGAALAEKECRRGKVVLQMHGRVPLPEADSSARSENHPAQYVSVGDVLKKSQQACLAIE